MFHSRPYGSPQLGGPVTSENRYSIGIRTIFLPSTPLIVSVSLCARAEIAEGLRPI